MKTGVIAGFLLIIIWHPAGNGLAQTLDEAALINLLREGGLVLVMRHASSPRQAPTADTANPDNINLERQLDEAGRRDAMAMGESIRRLGIPITGVDSSPAYRTLETARLAGFVDVRIRDYLGNQGMVNASEVFTDRLLADLEAAPPAGNRLLITHSPNIAAAFPELDPETEQGEVLVIDPRVSVTVPVARVAIGVWPGLP